MNWVLVLAWAAVVVAVGSSVLQAAEPPEFQMREFPAPDGEALKYVLYVPANLSADRPVPLLVYLHGSSADCVTHERILKESNLQFWHGYGRNVQREPTILMAPVGGQGGWTGDARQQAVLGIIDGLLEEFPVDRQRIYLQGFSMGGGGTWHFIQQRPGFFAAANPQASGGRAVDPELVKDTPIWATIGSNDRSAGRMAENVAAIRAANGDDRGGLPEVTGVNPRFTVFANTDHGGAQVATQQIPGFMDWMYAQVNDGNVPPNVRFVQPALHANAEGDTVQAVVVATDAEGAVARVEFYHADTLVSTDTQEPYEHTYTSLPPGPQLLRARAIDAGGKSRTAELTIEMGAVLTDGDALLLIGGRQLPHLGRHVRWSLGQAVPPLDVQAEVKHHSIQSIRQMDSEGAVTELIRTGPARFVVLGLGQVDESTPTGMAAEPLEDLSHYVDVAREAGRHAVVLMTWASNPAGRPGGVEEFRQVTEDLVGRARQLQQDQGVLVVPAGLVFYDLTIDPPAPLAGQRMDYLYSTPNSTQSELGEVAVVAALYAVTTGRSPVGLPVWDRLDPAMVGAVQQRVWQIVQDWQAGRAELKPPVLPAAAPVAPAELPPAGEPLWPALVRDGDRVYFVGNSFIGGEGGLQNHLRSAAAHASPPLALETFAKIYWGTPLSRMHTDEVAAEVRTGLNAVVVATSGDDGDLKRFRDLITGSGSAMVVHLTWGRNPTIDNRGLEGFREQTVRLVEQGLAFEQETGVPVVPCGLIFWDLIADPPMPGLRNDFVFIHENIHQNALGTLANVSAHYAVLTGRSPVGLPMWEPYDPALVRAVQERAWQIVQDWKAGKPVVKPLPQPGE